MITPRFALSQDERFVTLEVHVPFIRVANTDIAVDGCSVSVFCKPYLLKLVLPGEVQDDECSSAVHDTNRDNGTLTIKLSKVTPGEVFEDLDLITKLMQPRVKPSRALQARPLIEVVGGDDVACNEGEGEGEVSGEVSGEMGTSGAHVDETLLGRSKYGFGMGFEGFFADLRTDFVGLVELPDPDTTPWRQRRQMRVVAEDAEFDRERFQADTAFGEDDPLCIAARAFVPHWRPTAHSDPAPSSRSPPAAAKAFSFAPISDDSSPSFCDGAASLVSEQAQSGTETFCFGDGVGVGSSPADAATAAKPSRRRVGCRPARFASKERRRRPAAPASTIPPAPPRVIGPRFDFTEQEQEQLRALPNTDPLIGAPGSPTLQEAMCSVLDVLLAYAYDHRLTCGEPNVESAWTIRTLSPTLCWLERYAVGRELPSAPIPVADVLVGFARRCLTKPYLRQRAFAELVMRDTGLIFRGGRRVLLRCLLQVHRILGRSEIFYLHNTLYVSPMCVWLQRVRDDDVDAFAVALRREVARFNSKRSIATVGGHDIDELEREVATRQQGN